MTIILALDAMGGDHAPHIVIEGASLALKQSGDIFFNFFGKQDLLMPLISKYPNLQNHFQIHHTDEVVTNDTKPVQAIRSLRQSSMRLAIESVAEGTSHAVISAGNTGAYMALSKIILKTLDGIDRPAIAAVLPTRKGACVALDLGANVDCSVDNLTQFAVMGEVVARRILHKDNPSIGLLNVGTEELKGSAIVQQASQVIKDVGKLNYVGFVEGNDLTSGKVDVIVTDGFTGNVALKSIEGVGKFINSVIKSSLSSSWRGKLGFSIAKPVFDLIKNRMDPRLYNGAIFIGLRSIAVKSHGGADAISFANAIKITVELSQKMNPRESMSLSNNNLQTIAQEIEENLKEYT